MLRDYYSFFILIAVLIADLAWYPLQREIIWLIIGGFIMTRGFLVTLVGFVTIGRCRRAAQTSNG